MKVKNKIKYWKKCWENTRIWRSSNSQLRNQIQRNFRENAGIHILKNRSEWPQLRFKLIKRWNQINLVLRWDDVYNRLSDRTVPQILVSFTLTPLIFLVIFQSLRIPDTFFSCHGPELTVEHLAKQKDYKCSKSNLFRLKPCFVTSV